MNLSLTNTIAARLCAASGWDGPEYIDHGNSAAVYRVVHPQHGIAALKVYDPLFFEGDNALIEAKRVALQADLKGHGHPYLIEILEAAEIKEASTWYLLMEFCPWPSLEGRLGELPDNCVHPLIRKLAEAVIFLDSQGLVHRDIKPANISVSPDFQTLKLLDLGVVRKIAPDEGSGTVDDEKRRFIATAQYSPPEYLTREELPGVDGFAAINVYQVGAVLHDLIMKVAIFQDEAVTQNKYILYKAVTTKKPRLANPHVPVRLVALCARALEKDARTRVATVTLTDFLADADDQDALRRRLGGRSHRPAAARAPSLHVWRNLVRTWIAAAARQERDTLGAFTMPQSEMKGGNRWQLRFDVVERTVGVELVTAGDRLHMRVVSDTQPPAISTLLEIIEGAQIDQADVVTLLAGELLYALDLAVTAGEAVAPEHGGER